MIADPNHLSGMSTSLANVADTAAAAMASGLGPKGLRTPSPEAFDALADLFLGDAGLPAAPTDAPTLAPLDAAPAAPAPPPCPPPAPHAATAGRLHVEGLLLGHLPVMAGAWAGQYIRARAESIGAPLAVVRHSPGRLRIDLHGCMAVAHTAGRSLDAALLDVPPELGHAVVVLDAAPATLPPGLSGMTLLTSGDEMGVVGAYRALKLLAQARDADACAALPPIRIAVAGAGGARSAAVHLRLQEAAQSFLGVQLEPGGSIERVATGRAGVTIFDGPSPLAPEEVLRLLARRDAPAPRPPATAQFQITDEIDPAGALERTAERADQATDDLDPALPTAPVAAAATPAPAAAVDEPPAHDEPPIPETGSAAAPLAAHVAGALGIAARCPFAEDVQLAVDGAGRIHVLARGEAIGIGACVERLTAVAAWACQHRRLLALTVPDGLRIDGQAAPVLHLFTGSPAAARRLLDSEIRVHLLVVAAAPGLLSAALN